jgi:AcrR family transcriptional regulator
MSLYGYRGMTMRQLASALGLRAGSLYNYVHSKEQLLWEIVRLVSDEFLATASSARAEPDPVRRLRKLTEGHVRVIANHMSWSKVFVDEWKELSPPLRDRVLEMRRSYEVTWKQAIEEGIRQGKFSVAPALVSLTAKFLLGALNWMPQWYRPEGAMSLDAIAEAYCRLALAAVGYKRGNLSEAQGFLIEHSRDLTAYQHQHEGLSASA